MRAAVITAGPLGLAFLKALRAKNFEIIGVGSSCEQISQYCLREGIRCIAERNEFYERLRGENFEYLFSIINPQIIPAWVLSLPTVAALNYHDSLLPKHRGVNAVPWALWEGDSEIGYTWHVMNPSIDSGEIFWQSSIALSGFETTRQANLKVFVKVVSEFSAFLDRVARFGAKPFALVKQDLSLGAIHLKRHKPSEADRTIGESWSHAQILAKSRALDFGDAARPFGQLLVSHEGRLVACEPLPAAPVIHANNFVRWQTSDAQELWLRIFG